MAFHRHKATDTELPRQFGYNMPLELVLTVTPFLIISVLFYFTVVVQEKMLHLASDPEGGECRNGCPALTAAGAGSTTTTSVSRCSVSWWPR